MPAAGLELRAKPNNACSRCVPLPHLPHSADRIRTLGGGVRFVAVCATGRGHPHVHSPSNAAMTTPTERTRALLCAGSFLVDLVRDETLPLPVRRKAATIARHFPTLEDVSWIAGSLRESVLSIQMASPEQVFPEEGDWDFTPLRHSTRLRWPGGE